MKAFFHDLNEFVGSPHTFFLWAVGAAFLLIAGFAVSAISHSNNRYELCRQEPAATGCAEFYLSNLRKGCNLTPGGAACVELRVLLKRGQ
jgi:hypothetical protein